MALFGETHPSLAYAAKRQRVAPEAMRKPVVPHELWACIAALCPVFHAWWNAEDLDNHAPAAAGMFIEVPFLNVLFVQHTLGPRHALPMMDDECMSLTNDVTLLKSILALVNY